MCIYHIWKQRENVTSNEDCRDDQPSMENKYITGGGTVTLTVSLLVLYKTNQS